MCLSRIIYLFYMLLLSYSTIALAEGVALHGNPALKEGENPTYVRFDAPKGGRLITGVLGSFDTINPFNLKGTAGPEIRHYTVESLMKRHMNEPFALYPWLASQMIIGDKRLSVRFKLNNKARFSDETRVTAQDILFSYNLLRTEGRPHYRTYYNKVTKVETPNDETIIFHLKEGEDRELPLILALMPIMKANQFVEGRFAETSLSPVIASGAYVITQAKPGERITMQLNKNWWAKDLPLNKGQQNFEELRFDFYRDQTALVEAFKKGLVDWRFETDPARWRELKTGNQNYYEIKTNQPLQYRAYFFNIRRDYFKDKRIREALNLIFDAEFINKQLYEGQYTRVTSIFTGSELASNIVKHETSRATLREALALFKQVGYEVKNGVMQDAQGKAFTPEIIVNTRDKERLARATAAQFAKAGITLSIRLLDNVQYEFRLQRFDYDLIDTNLTSSLSPGNEQAVYWGSKAALSEGSRNYVGLQDSDVDASIAKLILAETREDIISNAKLLDKRLSELYVTIPLFQPSVQYIALQKHIKMPDKQSNYGYLPEVWWKE
jgi:peptide/nickel transport system substrate-binding protein